MIGGAERRCDTLEREFRYYFARLDRGNPRGAKNSIVERLAVKLVVNGERKGLGTHDYVIVTS
jgi:hypothetical protein